MASRLTLATWICHISNAKKCNRITIILWESFHALAKAERRRMKPFPCKMTILHRTKKCPPVSRKHCQSRCRQYMKPVSLAIHWRHWGKVAGVALRVQWKVTCSGTHPLPSIQTMEDGRVWKKCQGEHCWRCVFLLVSPQQGVCSGTCPFETINNKSKI